ncbi:MAG: hypothetical protein QW478_04675 [Candidatus Micrarchaeaceae archaeon]
MEQEKIDEMKKLKAEGRSIAEIARRMNMPYVKVAYYVGDYKQKIIMANKARHMLKIAIGIASEKLGTTNVHALEGTPTILEGGIERWEFKAFIGDSEPYVEKYINIINKRKYEIVDKE